MLLLEINGSSVGTGEGLLDLLIGLDFLLLFTCCGVNNTRGGDLKITLEVTPFPPCHTEVNRESSPIHVLERENLEFSPLGIREEQ